MTLEYEPIRDAERYLRRFFWRCWCVQPVKQRRVWVMQPSGVVEERWIDA